MLNDPWQRYTAIWRELCGLRPLDHPSFSGVSRVWRAAMHPTFHDDVVITLTDVDAGGWIELRVLSAKARVWAMGAAGIGAPMHGEPPSARVWEDALSADVLSSVAAAMPRLPLHSVGAGGRDGMTIDHEALVDGAEHRFSSWSPTQRTAPLHHAFVVALCTLAARRFADPAAQAAIQPLAIYLR